MPSRLVMDDSKYGTTSNYYTNTVHGIAPSCNKLCLTPLLCKSEEMVAYVFAVRECLSDNRTWYGIRQEDI
jgi:hypothetical protein